MAKFLNKRNYIEAVQWKGTNGSEIDNWIKHCRIDNLGPRGALQIHFAKRILTVPINSWVVLDNLYFRLTNAQFLKRYQPLIK